MREWEWKFDSVDVRDFDGFPETVVNVKVSLVLKDHDLDMAEMSDLSCSFQAPNTDGFVDYDNITPEMLRDWVVGFHSRGNDQWLPTTKDALIANLEKRASTQTRVVRARVSEVD